MHPPVPPAPPLSPGLLPPFAATPCGLPVGSITAFAGQVAGQSPAPNDAYVTQVETSGWMVCDGRVLDRAQFPELFQALGYRYLQKGETSGSSFRIPDLQGYFLRGVDPLCTIDPDTATRNLPNGQPAPPSSPQVGSTQTSAFQVHEHDYLKPTVLPVLPQGEGEGASNVTTPSVATSKVVVDPTGTTPLTSTKETRPTNVAVYYLIKFTSAVWPWRVSDDGSRG